ncbi:MAG: hypothetical protein WCO84_01220 [bacterium]
MGIENNCYIQYSVSDWHFLFEDGERVLLQTIKEECVRNFVDNKTEIELIEAVYYNDLLKLLSSGKKIINLERRFTVGNLSNGNREYLAENYGSVKVLYSEERVGLEEASTFTIKLKKE